MSKKRTVIRYATKERKAKIPQENIDAYERYLRSRVARNKDVKETTYRQYRSAMYIFMTWLANEYDENALLLDQEFLDEEFVDVMDDFIYFCQDVLKNGKKKINFNLSTISSYYEFAVERGYVTHNPMQRVRRMENAHDDVRVESVFLNKEQCQEIVSELEKVTNPDYTKYDRQDRLMWHIGFDSAARIGALHRLKVSKLRLDENKFVNIREKRGKIVEIVFYPDTAEMIEEYLEWREENGVDCDDFFVTRYDNEWQGMSMQAMHNRMKKIGHIIGIDNWRFHNLRKTRLNMIADIDITLAQEMANHESLDTTSKFYTKPKEQSDVVAKLIQLEQQEKDK